uniref:Cytochrome b6/f complex subunit VIII n=1 Tax=Lithothamnion sp. TaxID=1940749 RepID=A0A3G3MGA0_9FLOR|nr:cytochrome b6/f complex subunit VIII [Lithothamnion sp.]
MFYGYYKFRLGLFFWLWLLFQLLWLYGVEMVFS